MADEAKQEKDDTVKRVVAPLSPSRVSLMEYKQVMRTVFVPVGVEPDDLKDPDFWRHVARDLRVCDELKIFCEDMSWRSEACVVAVGPVSAQVAILNHTKLSGLGMDTGIHDNLFVEWAGPYHKHRVVRKTNEGTDPISTLVGFGTKDEAEVALREYRKTMRAR